MNKLDKLKNQIKEITFSDAETSDIKRENANINGNTAMGTMLQYGSAVSKYFCDEEVLNERYSDAHANGYIHIHDKDFYNMGTLTCCQIDLDKLFTGGFSTGHGHLREPNDIMSYAALAAIAIQSNQNDQHGGQSVPAFDFYMAKGVLKTFKKELKGYIRDFALMTDVLISTDTFQQISDFIDKHVNTIELNNCILNEISLMLNTIGLSEKDAEKVVSIANLKALLLTNRKTYQAMEGFVHNLNTMHSRAGAQVPFSSINLGTDITPEGRLVIKNLLLAAEAGLGHGETAIFPIIVFKVKEGVNYNEEDVNYDMFKLAMKVSAKRLFPNFSFLDAPYNLQYYTPNKPDTEVTYMGCRTRVIANAYDPSSSVVTGRGNLSFTTINLPRIGLKYGKALNEPIDYDGFFNELDSVMDLAMEQLYDRYLFQATKKVKNFPFLMGQGVWRDSENLSEEDAIEEIIKHGTLSLGFIGLAECLVALTGKHHGENTEAQEFGLKIISFMKEKLDNASKIHKMNFTLLATPAEGLAGRFVNIDRKIYGDIPGITDKEYYTNSFHIPVCYNVNAFNKIGIEAPYHALCNAGHITYVEMDGNARHNPEAFELIVRKMKESGIGYGSINHPVDRCPACGYNGVIGNICPSCKVSEDDVKFERIRRITGYLVGTLDRWNNAKISEEKDRVKHITSKAGDTLGDKGI